MLHTKSRKGFSMIELVFVIVILGILAAVAIPRFSATRVDAQISKARADIAAIRSAIISERQSRLIKGESSWVDSLSSGTSTLFTGPDNNHTLLMYGISAGTEDGKWSKSSTAGEYIFHISGQNCTFKYDKTKGTFNLKSNQAAICSELVN